MGRGEERRDFRELMKKEYDLRKLTQRPGEPRVDLRAAKVPVSIRLDGAVLAELRTEAQRLGIPYQTLIGGILYRYVRGDLLDPKCANLRGLLDRAS